MAVSSSIIGTIEEANFFIEELPPWSEGVVHDIPKEELNEISMEANSEGSLIHDITDRLKRKEPRTYTEILRCAMMAYATNKESEHHAGTGLSRGIPKAPPPVKKLCVRIGRKFYEKIKQETLDELRNRNTLPDFNDDDADDSSTSSEDSLESAESEEDDVREEIKDLPMPLNFDFKTPDCGQILRVQLIVPSVFLDLVATQLDQMDVDRKRIFSLDDLVQLGRRKAEEVSLDYDKMLRSKLWITAMQKRSGIDWQEFPFILESLSDPNFGNPDHEVVLEHRPKTEAGEVILNGSRKVAIKMHQRN